MKFLLLSLLTVFFLLQTYSSAPEEFAPVDRVAIPLLTVLVVLLEIAIAYLIRRFLLLQNILLAIVAVANVIAVHLFLVGSFLSHPLWLQLLLSGGGFFLALTVFSIASEHRAYAIVGATLLAASCLFSLAHTEYRIAIGNKVSSTTMHGNGLTSASNIRLVEFRKRPNVYFIEFDSLLPRTLMRLHFGIEGTAYHDVLDKEFRSFKNTFADAVATRASLNSLLALDHQHFTSLSRMPKSRHVKLFQGMEPSPLFQIFKHNGYTTNTLFNSNYFGPAKGPFVDKYWINVPKGACEFMDKNIISYAFFGYCELRNIEWFNRWTGADLEKSKVSFLLDSIRKSILSGKPQVWVAYIYSPGHTKKSHTWNDKESMENYINIYIENSRQTAKYIRQIVEFIHENDPQGILLIFGDHGPWLSRGMRRDSDPSFYYRDRYGIYGGVFPADVCADWFSKSDADDLAKFVTPIMVARQTIECLSSGVRVNIQDDEFRPLERNKDGYLHGTAKYEDFFYE